MQIMRKTTVHILSITTSGLLTMAGASLTVISCTKTTAPGTEASPEGAITFSGVDTKAAVDTPNDISSFSVWGWYSDDAAGTDAVNVFDAEKVSKIADGSWTYDGLRYWLSGKTYYFYALYPDVAVLMEEISPAASKVAYDSNGTLTVTDFDATKNIDLMTAVKADIKTGTPVQNPGPVELDFSHLLTRLAFSVESVGRGIQIVSFKVNGVIYKGNLVHASGISTWSDTIRSTDGDGLFYASDISVAAGEIKNMTGDMLLPPHADLNDAEISMIYRFEGEDDSVNRTSNVLLSSSQTVQWDAGSSYRYVLTVSSATLTLKVTVLDWNGRDTSVSWQ